MYFDIYLYIVIFTYYIYLVAGKTIWISIWIVTWNKREALVNFERYYIIIKFGNIEWLKVNSMH